MKRSVFGESIIASAGYDALTKELVVEFTQTNWIVLFNDVPEEIWYGLYDSAVPDDYFRRCIRGKFEERRL